MKAIRTLLQGLLVIAALAPALPAAAAGDLDKYLVPAARVDSGLGELPPCAEWRATWLYSTPAPREDDGLGKLANVSEWHEVWLYSTPAEKIANESASEIAGLAR